MLKTILVTVLFAGISTVAFTQAQVSVGVRNEQGAPLEQAIVELLRPKDSSLYKSVLADKEGLAVLERVSPGNYLVRASMVGYASRLTEAYAITGNITLPAIVLTAQPNQIKEVTVTARKPFIQKLNDRIVVNVESSIMNAGASAMEVLERSPGVSIDQNDVIALRGKQGITIMIDGKPSPMSGADLANYLRGLPSNAIERIDIITNPSAKFDAAGNAGIIDIRMKKDQRMGTNGTVSAGYGQGVYPKANAGATFNYRTKKINLFGNYNYSKRKGLNHLTLDRNFYNNGVFSGGDLKDNYGTSPGHSHAMRFGADYFPDSKNIIGFVLSGNINRGNRRTDNQSTVINAQHNPASTFQTTAENGDKSHNILANINYKHQFAAPGKTFTADIDYGSFSSNSLSVTGTRYYNLDGSVQQPAYILQGDQQGKLTLRTAKADFVNPFKNGLKLETGMKTSYVSSDNNALFYDISTGTPQEDINKTNRFFYDEFNNAAYLNLYREYKKLDVQVGLRAEHTHIKTKQVKGDIRFDSSYLQLFPSAFVNYRFTEDQTLGISVSRRIDRPAYSQLNPFLFLIDVTTYSTGNPALLPQFTWSYELSYTLKNIAVTLGYSHTVNDQNIAIARFKDVFPNIPQADNITVQIPVNLSSSDYFGVTVTAPFRISNAWSILNNINAYYNKYNGRLGTTRLNNGRPALDLRTNNNFTIGNGWSAELNLNFASGGQYGFMVMDPQWGIGAGVQKTVWKNKGTVRFNISDIFRTNLPKAVITYDNYIEKWHAVRESRVANISFTYRFGKNTVQAARKRSTGSEEERQRAGN
ncbi:TonB-dependent receptor domain-containing protein [Sediminibacterium ginsengisoli]|uniref:Outer membrane receptor proteins, mostly Fe transport n=1 Tax=Sediminibacterium ginsengisoli TaxID=413434 RepID=A0A1T4MIU1_9BACT|nr:TonB-dependent receptor [Sediminibacterium ginsengisoli]SJZ67020.1 Outer membrane receptor proteins, mostly Fe transport [Sediminibacterium ginsengisoli]